MIVFLMPRDDETGVLHGEFRDGDISSSKFDTDPIGNQEKKSRLPAHIDVQQGESLFVQKMNQAEYSVDQFGQPQLKTAARYYIPDWRTRFSSSEIAAIEDSTALIANGPLSHGNGAEVIDGIVHGVFTVEDITQK